MACQRESANQPGHVGRSISVVSPGLPGCDGRLTGGGVGGLADTGHGWPGTGVLNGGAQAIVATATLGAVKATL